VKQLDVISPMLVLSVMVTALPLSPIATELPKIMNAVIWVRQGKTATGAGGAVWRSPAKCVRRGRGSSR
jgi:Ca2+/Na+ antiporter